MKIALYQTNILREDKKELYSVGMKQKNIDLFPLPEMSFIGFFINTEKTKESDFKTVNRMADYAKEYHAAIRFGWVKDYREKSENHYTIVNKEGERYF